MIRFLKASLFFAMLLQLLSCTPGAPYEVRSPCVSNSQDDDPSTLLKNPCVRRPVNLDVA